MSTLRVAMEANAAAYRRAVQTSAPGDCWDFVVLTAANEKQAQGYRQELALRHRAVGPAGSFFPAIQKSLVVPDPPGRRAGSGGATLGVMKELSRQYRVGPEDFDRLRILLIHSGGASQRLPAYSPLGKIFAPLPLLRPDGQISTLFDHLYITLAGLPERLGPGMLILAGDVFLLFDHRHVGAPRQGVTALTMRVPAEMGRGHGVFVTGPDNRIQRTLQKVPVETMREAGATDQRGQVLIDSGLLFFDPDRARLLTSLAAGHSTLGACKEQIDLYDDMTAALAAATSRKDYISANKPWRRHLWKALHGIPFQTMTLDGEFLHLGTTRQFRDAMVGQNPSPAAELFQQNILVHSDGPLPADGRVYHSVLLGRSSMGRGSVIEHSILKDAKVGAGCVVSQVQATSRPLRLPEDLLLFQVPIRCPRSRRERNKARAAATADAIAFVHVVCGIEDDFKTPYAPGQCLFLNRPIEEFLRKHRLRADQVWPGIAPEQRTLWMARLFPATARRDQADAALALLNGPAQGKSWNRLSRFSMAQLLELADPMALIEHREVVAAHLHSRLLLESLRGGEDRPLDGLIPHYSTPAAYAAAIRQLECFAGSSSLATDHLAASRALWCAAQLLHRPDYPDPPAAFHRAEQYMMRAFGRIAEASEIAVADSPIRPGTVPPHLRPGIRIEAASPVRLDLSGGWSDTPPYCYERGGHVVNVAINLDSHPPVRAMVRTIAEPVLILESHDLGTHIELKKVEPLDRAAAVKDPFALHKMALDLAGLLPPSGLLLPHLKRLGAGLIVSTECRVPKGSGLGTSSILAATLLAALHELTGQTARNQEHDLIGQTLLLEQRLSTGGGWQDQVGGIVGGVKSTTTAPGIPQKPQVERLALPDELLHGLEERLVVYYSGQQRLARDILRRVMGRWIAREPAVILLLDDLKRSAAALRAALLKGNWPAAAREIARYWEIKKQLYPGSTTPTIDVLFLELREHYLAAGLAGAGGGGFAYFFCKHARQAQRLRELLAERSARPGSLGALFQTQINRQGLCVAGSGA